MKKGSIFANLAILLTVASMYMGIIYNSDLDLATYAVMVVVGVMSIISLDAIFSGVNKVISMYSGLRRVRKIIMSINAKEPNNVWEHICKQNFIFKNRVLDIEMNNFKKEMDRLEVEEAIYCQPDIKDYISKEKLYSECNKKFLDNVAKIISLVGIIGILGLALVSLEDLSGGLSMVILIEFGRPLMLITLCALVFILEYIIFYNSAMAKLAREYDGFISDFYKNVLPAPKYDLANNILYLQQVQIKNTDVIVADAIETIENNAKDILIRQSEKASELGRQVENACTVLKKFSDSIEETKVVLRDQIEKQKLISDNEIKTIREAFVRIENIMKDLSEANNELAKEVSKEKVEGQENKVEEQVEETVEVQEEKAEEKVEELAEVQEEKAEEKVEETAEGQEEKAEEKVEETAEGQEEKAEEKVEQSEEVQEDKVEESVQEQQEEEKKETKKTTRKTTAKKTTTKRATRKKKEDEDSKVIPMPVEAVVEEAVTEEPVKKRRGRKPKAVKEAELKAAMELAKLENKEDTTIDTEEK